MQKISAFEYKSCGRCDGTGQTGFTWVHGGVCFKCGGTGLFHTKRGAVAYDMYQHSLEMPAAEAVASGRKLYVQGINAGSFQTPSYWAALESVTENADGTLDIAVEGMVFSHTAKDSPMRVSWTAEEKAEKKAAALAFMATLNQRGEVSKNPGRAARVQTPEQKLAAAEKRAARKAEKAAEEKATRAADWAIQNPDAFAFLQTIDTTTEQFQFLVEMVATLRAKGDLTPGQTAAVVKIAAKRAEQAVKKAADAAALAVAPVVPEGRVKVTGEVVTTKLQESQDYRFRSTMKMLVKLDDGNKVWGTVPAGLGNVQAGDRVSFTATLERKEDHFAYFSRPTA